MKEAQRRCLQCWHCMRDPAATPEQIIVGQVPHLCLCAPPLTIPIVTARGMALMTLYPNVNKDTLSCGSFACETPAGGQQEDH